MRRRQRAEFGLRLIIGVVVLSGGLCPHVADFVIFATFAKAEVFAEQSRRKRGKLVRRIEAGEREAAPRVLLFDVRVDRRDEWKQPSRSLRQGTLLLYGRPMHNF